MSINMVKIRAKITIGNLTVETPFIKRFTVNKTRGQISTFSASLMVPAGSIAGSISGDNVKIKAGRDSANNTIFSGIVQQANITPVFEDPTYVLLNISGSDILSILRGKKYSRRSVATESSWVSIDSVVRQGWRGGKFAARLVDGKKVDTTETATGGIDTAALLPEGDVIGDTRTGKGEIRSPLATKTVVD